jgi:tetratricopeptide (TPR) repeat protein
MILPESGAPNLPTPTANAAAWHAYLRGREAMNRGTPDDVQQAIASFDSALQLDPAFAGGWAQRAEAGHLLVMVGGAAPRDAYPAVARAADRALQLDPTLADAHLARGLVQLWYDWRPADAGRSFERAIAHNGSHAAAHHDYAWSLLALGRDNDAIRHITMARDLDPLSARANTDIGWLYLQLRRPAEATRACRHTLAIQPQSLEAQACLERAAIQSGPVGDDVRAVWRTRLDALRTASRTRWVSPYTLAVHELLLGENAPAIEHLESAVDARVGMMVFFDRDPALDPLRADARFAALAQRVTAESR